MTEKKSNFLPLLLIGGGLAGAALLYSVGTKQSKEDSSLVGGVGVGGSRDFLGSSGISKGYDSVDLGVEDFAFNRASPDAYALPSDGAANPENVVDDVGEWGFVDTAVLGLTAAAAVPPIAKAVKSAGSKVAGSTVLRTAGRVAGVAGVGALAPLAVETGVTLGAKAGESLGGSSATSVQTAFNAFANAVGNILTYPAQVLAGKISTDEATKENVGNMVTDRQERIASGLAAGKYTVSKASSSEAALVNQAAGLSNGDVLKVSGEKFTSYVAEDGHQVSYSTGGTLAGTVKKQLDYQASKSTTKTPVGRH